jgi:DNA ligase-4
MSDVHSFTDLSNTITKNGGRIVDLDEPKLTHVIIDKRDDSRRLELMKRTSKSASPLLFTALHASQNFHARPKRRHLVISEFIQACLEEGTLLDEDGELHVMGDLISSELSL